MSIQIIEHTYKANKPVVKRPKTSEIILHCEATPEGRDYTVEQVDRWHKERDFACIGYHYIIYRDGSVHRGRWETMKGEHTKNHNDRAIGISYVGGCEATKGKDEKYHAKDTRTPWQCFAMYELVHYLLRKYNLKLSAVHCHNEFAAKACPSFKIEQFKKEFKEYYYKENWE